MARRGRGVLVTAFSFLVVPRGEDRIHTRMSAADDLEELDRTTAAFAEVGRELGVIAWQGTREAACFLWTDTPPS